MVLVGLLQSVDGPIVRCYAVKGLFFRSKKTHVYHQANII